MKLWELLVNLTALLLPAAMLIAAWLRQAWMENLIELLVAGAGTVFCLFPDEASDCSGRYGWTRSQWRSTPAGWMKFTGIVQVLLAAHSFFSRGSWLTDRLR